MKKKDKALAVKISTPREVLWEGEAESISSENAEGKFDILPQHIDFITLIQGKPIIVRTEEGDKQFSFKDAVIHVSRGDTRIFGDV